MERFVAIDNVCAWPNLTLMGDGAIVATIFNQPVHGLWEGDVECWASEDEGRTWAYRGTAASHEPGTNRMNVAAGLARDGALIVLASGWGNRPAAGTTEEPGPSEIVEPWVCRSEDGGRTWTHSETIARTPDGSSWRIPFGDIVEIDGGWLMALFYAQGPGASNHALCYFSDDDGRTWKVGTLLRSGNINETCAVVLEGGHVLTAGRTMGDGHLDLLRSTDGGKSWRDEGRVTWCGHHPGHLLVLADGRVLLVYGLRGPDIWGVGYRISEDMGGTWGPPRILVDLGCRDVDCGYPASVQADNGTIVTAYYAARTPAHERYHMGVVRWEAE